jgi:putative lipoic acid-binding regulatory protein
MEYASLWVNKITGPDADEKRRAVADIICDRTYKISHSRSSATAKYHCLNVELLVESESHRTAIYDALKAHKTIKLVL